MYVMIGHVNLTLGQRFSEVSPHYYQGDKLTIDFLPPSEVRGLKTRVIPEKTIVAMYMNNRAVESMADGRLDDAYWWAREAVKQDPKFTSAFNTLGAIYEQHGDLKAAERVLSYVLTREPKNTRAMSNLATALDGLGRSVEAGELRTEMARLEPDPPFSYFNRGLAAMSHADYKLAKAMFAKEVDRAPYYHEFHYWLAAACAQLGELDTARQQLALAIENSPTRRARDIYAAKLDKINAYRTQ
jgi:Flp pilus assembly protein TadD